MVREFSEEKRQEIFRLLDEIDNSEWKSFMEWCGSSAEEFGDWSDRLAVSAYTKYVDEYHKKVLETNEMTRNRVNTVFENVAEIETRYAGRMKECQVKIKEQIATVKTMTEFMQSMTDGNSNMALITKGSVNENCIRMEDDDEDEEENTEIPVVKWEDAMEPFEERGPRVLAQCLRDHGITDQDEIDRVLEWIMTYNLDLLKDFDAADFYDGYYGYNKERIYNRIMKYYRRRAREIPVVKWEDAMEPFEERGPRVLAQCLRDHGITDQDEIDRVLEWIMTYNLDLLKDFDAADFYDGYYGFNKEETYNTIMENYIEGAREYFLEYAADSEYDGYFDWGQVVYIIQKFRPGLLKDLNEIQDNDKKAEIFESIINIYNEYRIDQGAIILENFIKENSEILEEGQKPELIVPLFRFYDSKRLIYLYGIKDASAQKAYCEWLLEISKKYAYFQKFYVYTWLQINNIESFTNNNVDNLDFNDIVDDFVRIYRDHEELYTRIAKETGVPPVEVAVIHYRENSVDYINETFSIRLHDGHSLNEPYTYLNDNRERETKTFNSFEDAAIHAIQLKQYCINNLNLSFDTTDIVTMVCFAEAYNGTGYYDNNFICPYSYSGTDVYVSGKYTSDHDYDSDAVDEQIGTYRLLLAAEAGIYDAEDGKNYVNEMCGGDTQ